ncbi:conserved hypothetical protein [uncultured Dysgonomonas sp.]|uniref:Uncharacterized protein n=1 Tax=uncultured Dysgonomonas sp. TaxID=206096 RepID=A0A212KAL1_9BACT|nr:conserved hypothetical protein [uncultured Dysgonomonas sp.]
MFVVTKRCSKFILMGEFNFYFSIFAYYHFKFKNKLCHYI